MTEPTLSAARSMAQRVHTHFAEHVRTEREAGHADIGPQPDEAAIEALIDVAFWASLRREEGRGPKVSVALVPPSHTDLPLLFEQGLPLTPDILTRLAPAVDRPGIHLGVWRTGDALSIWGASRTIPALCVVVEVVAPGLLVVKQRRRDAVGKYLNVVVLEGDRIKVIAEETPSLPDCPAMVAALRGFDSPASWSEPVNVLVQLAVSIRAHGRGGTLLVVPHGTDSWLESVVRPMPYAVAPPFAVLAERVRALNEAATEHAMQLFQRTIDGVAGLTGVDGATVLTDSYHLLAFGAKIVQRRGSQPVEQVVLTEPLEGASVRDVHPSELGGTRHLSAAQFVQDQHAALALVASQDGRFTVFAWSPCQDRVHAHRVESLLLVAARQPARSPRRYGSPETAPAHLSLWTGIRSGMTTFRVGAKNFPREGYW